MYTTRIVFYLRTRVLYKYLNPARIDVLQNLKVRFTQPCELNDPFESALLVEAGCYASWEEQAARLEAELNPQSDEERAMLEMVKDELREEAQQMMTPQAVGRELADRINKAQGVYSLSRTNDTLLMWAHYCESHKGFVLGLDDSHPWFRAEDPFGNATEPHNVIYTSRRIPVIVGTEDFYERLLCYKSLEWAYEQEVRIFRTFGSTQEQFEKNKRDSKHLFDIPRECIKEIFIGANASKQLREDIFKEAHQKNLNVNIFEAYVDDARYAINFRHITAINR